MKIIKYLLLSVIFFGIVDPMIISADTISDTSIVLNDKHKEKNKQASVITTGTWGTANWTLNDDGSFIVDGGTVSGPLYKAPGITAIQSKITSISFSGIGGKTKTEANGREFLGTYGGYPLGNVTKIDLANVDTSDTTDFSCFLNSHPLLTEIKNMDVLDTSKATTMNAFISGNNILKSVDVSSFDTSNVTDFTNMFVWDNELEKLDLSNFVVHASASKSSMLGQLQSLRTLILGDKVENLAGTSFGSIQGSSDRANRGPQYVAQDTWQNVGGGSEKWPTGSNVWTGGELSNMFDGKANTYVWKPIETGNINVNYVDMNGKSIASSDVLAPREYLGENYTTTPKEITGYILVTTPDNASGVYTEDVQTVTYVYKKLTTNTPTKPVAKGKLTVKYVDEAGTDLVNPVITTETAGTAYKTEKKDIKGYTFKEVKGNETGKYIAEDQTVTYVYKKLTTNTPTKPVAKGKLTVKYVDEVGTDLVDPVITTETAGTAYKTEKKDIKGYTFKEVKGNETGKYTADDQTVTYVYTKNNSNTNPINPDTPNDNNSNVDGKDNGVINNITKSVETVLPKTAAQKITVVGVISAVLASLAGLIVWKKRK